ncbi:MAG: hypothetical protein E7583_06890 [Ruminococcaceae bacterium]|nr:hypothetical protein [Oscillospiraceae bacterium]
MLPTEFLFSPSVFAVEDNYLICVAASCEATVSVRIGEEMFYDASNGILRSKKYLHMVEVPMEILDREKKYTVILREFTDRCPYWPKSNDPVEYTSDFFPVEKTENINIAYVSDTHGNVEVPSKAGSYFGDALDILVLGGDIADHSGDVENFKTLFNIAGNITNGKHPCIFSRGNHDLRGHCAEMLADYTPTSGGKSYYTVKLGCIWALVLDCSEDKADESAEYGHTIACHDFRLRETRFINKLIANKESEYDKSNVKYKLMLSHVPFAIRYEDPFNPEEEIYTEWCRLCRENIRPDLWLTGHKHTAEIIKCGDRKDDFGQPCTCVIGSKPDFSANTFVCALVTLNEGKADVIFADQNGSVTEKHTVEF